jgi:two-component system cell cycle sensor histidine kinase/response regulator CckA
VESRLDSPATVKAPNSTTPIRYAGFYLLVAGLWIVFSDRVLSAVAPDLSSFAYFQTLKGLLFVLATASILYVLLVRHRATLDEEVGSRLRSEAAAREVQERLRQAQKMEAIGQLAGGVAHDFNNLLVVIQGRVEMMRRHPELPPALRESCEEIDRAGERAAGLTRQLLLFGRRQVMQAREVDLNAVVTDTTKMLRRILGEDVEVRVRCSPEGLPLHADPGMIAQVLLNLAVNARDAMPDGGTVLIATSATERDERRFARIDVSDHGAGIPPEVLPRIFEPFFTTKEVGKGTGLGLATVFGVVQEHGGTIEVDSAVGRGTTFRVLFPLHGSPERARERAAPEELRGGNETILLAEDERTVRAMIVDLLTPLGYRVLEAASGVEAIEIVEGHDGAIDLVVTDLVMPGGVSGLELGRRLAASHPRTKVIYTSGYSTEIAGNRGELVEGVNFLSKPFSPRQLARLVRERLDER